MTLRPLILLIAALLGPAALAQSGKAAPPPGRELLRRAFDEMLERPPLKGAHVGLEVVSLEDGQVVYARAADELLNPASNTKLVTSAAALLRLGPEFRFTTEVRSDGRLPNGKVKNLYVKGGGDPTLNTERLQGLVADLFHRGVRGVQGDLVLDDSYFDAEAWGPGWEQEGSDKSFAAPVSALSLNHNSVGVYVWPADKRGGRPRVELEPESPYLTVESRVTTVRGGGRRRVVVHTRQDGDRTRVVVRGRMPAGRNGVVVYRRVYDATLYFGETLKSLLAQRGIKVTGKVRRGTAGEGAALVASYDSPELADMVRDMNKVSSNFMAEMLLKALGAEVRGAPGTWAKGVEVAQELLGELGLLRGSYVLKNGSGLNDTNRFSAHQLAALLGAVWKRFPVAAEFISSLGIAGRDGTLRLRMEGTDAAGRLRAKTGTLDHVTALSGYVQSVGGERFAFSILVNGWEGRSSPVVHSVDKLGGLLASTGALPLSPRDASLLQLAEAHGDEARPAELRARYATYAALGKAPDKKNLPFLRAALRTERDPLLRLAVADALYQNDPEQGGAQLLEAIPASTELFVRLRALGKELSLPLPVVSSLLDLAADGNADALSRLLALAPLATGQSDDLLATLSDGLVEVGHNAPDELLTALRAAPPEQSQALLELMGFGLAMNAEDASSLELADALRAAQGGDAAQAGSWLAVLQRRGIPAAASAPESAAQPTAVASTAPKGPVVTPSEDDEDADDESESAPATTAAADATAKPAQPLPPPPAPIAASLAAAPGAALPGASLPTAAKTAAAPQTVAAAATQASAPAAATSSRTESAPPAATTTMLRPEPATPNVAASSLLPSDPPPPEKSAPPAPALSPPVPAKKP